MSSNIDADKPNAGAALTADVRTNFGAAETELNDLHRISEDSITSTGTDIIVATYSPAATGPTSGQLFGFKAGGANTGAATFNPSELGALDVQVEGVALVANQIVSGGQYILKFDGSVYQLLNPSRNVVAGNLKVTGILNFPRTDLTIASDAVTVTGSYHRVDTQGAASTDDLDTINGGTQGDLLILSTVNSDREVTLKDGTGNMNLAAGDFTLSSFADTITLIFSSPSWLEISRSNNA